MHLDFILRELGFLVFHIFQFKQDYVARIKKCKMEFFFIPCPKAEK